MLGLAAIYNLSIDRYQSLTLRIWPDTGSAIDPSHINDS